VINLEATEVESGAGVAEPRPDAPAPPPRPEPSPPKVEEAIIPPPPSTPTHAAAGGPPSPEPPRDRPPEAPPAPQSGWRSFAWLPQEPSWGQMSAGIAGAAGGLFMFLLLWLVGAFSVSRDSPADLNPRLASIERQLHELAARPVPASVDPKALEGLAARLARLESVPASVDPKAVEGLAARLARLESVQATSRAPVTDPVVLGRLSAMEQAVKSIADNVAALSRRGDSVDAALRETQSRLDKMSASLNELQTTARAAAAGSDRAVRLALAAAALRTLVERGDPFTTEIAVVKPLMSDRGALAPLEPFAASGMPSNATLGQALVAIVRPLLRAAGAPARDGSLHERLQANVEKLVRIRPVDGPAGDDRSAILARIEQRAARGDIAGALAEIAKLSPAARGPLQGWMTKVETRNKAVDASRRIAADAMTALTATP
jgi:hypothetical protein